VIGNLPSSLNLSKSVSAFWLTVLLTASSVYTPRVTVGREISDWMEENPGNRVSAETISSITDRVLPEIQAWRSRPLDNVYAIVWMDAIHCKVMDEKNRPVTRAIYNIIGINPEGYKDLLGMYISKSEGANFRLSCLVDIQSGVKDILIACTDNLKGFPDAIQSVFPETTVQTCIVHQIRNSVKYVAGKNQKTFMKDLKPVYQAVSKEQAEVELDNLELKWGGRLSRCYQILAEQLGQAIGLLPVFRRH
jgi:transposase-like protein